MIFCELLNVPHFKALMPTDQGEIKKMLQEIMSIPEEDQILNQRRSELVRLTMIMQILLSSSGCTITWRLTMPVLKSVTYPEKIKLNIFTKDHLKLMPFWLNQLYRSLNKNITPPVKVNIFFHSLLNRLLKDQKQIYELRDVTMDMSTDLIMPRTQISMTFTGELQSLDEKIFYLPLSLICREFIDQEVPSMKLNSSIYEYHIYMNFFLGFYRFRNNHEYSEKSIVTKYEEIASMISMLSLASKELINIFRTNSWSNKLNNYSFSNFNFVASEFLKLILCFSFYADPQLIEKEKKVVAIELVSLMVSNSVLFRNIFQTYKDDLLTQSVYFISFGLDGLEYDEHQLVYHIVSKVIALFLQKLDQYEILRQNTILKKIVNILMITANRMSETDVQFDILIYSKSPSEARLISQFKLASALCSSRHYAKCLDWLRPKGSKGSHSIFEALKGHCSVQYFLMALDNQGGILTDCPLNWFIHIIKLFSKISFSKTALPDSDYEKKLLTYESSKMAFIKLCVLITLVENEEYPFRLVSDMIRAISSELKKTTNYSSFLILIEILISSIGRSDSDKTFVYLLAEYIKLLYDLTQDFLLTIKKIDYFESNNSFEVIVKFWLVVQTILKSISENSDSIWFLSSLTSKCILGFYYSQPYYRIGPSEGEFALGFCHYCGKQSIMRKVALPQVGTASHRLIRDSLGSLKVEGRDPFKRSSVFRNQRGHLTLKNLTMSFENTRGSVSSDLAKSYVSYIQDLLRFEVSNFRRFKFRILSSY
jgi:hypothetical protein